MLDVGEIFKYHVSEKLMFNDLELCMLTGVHCCTALSVIATSLEEYNLYLTN